MIFKAIGDYKVYEDGTIISVKGHKEKVLKPRLHCRGYYKVCLRINNVSKDWLVHRLVATLFIPNPENKKQIDHIDGNKANNAVNNLRWSTALENRHNINTTDHCNGHFRAKNAVTENGYRIYTYYRNSKYKYTIRHKIKENINGNCL